ncbi:diguanylate cyclase, partial [Streptomyces sp. NPDC005534]
MTEYIADVAIPDSKLAQDATDLIRDTTPALIFHHSRRVYLFGS